ncbi:MAG: phosphodiester glycosidase family protein [Planctomycetes bacterium]|nr:phosphodiester glycosidase family protein [Planctomycetota bacterium]
MRTRASSPLQSLLRNPFPRRALSLVILATMLGALDASARAQASQTGAEIERAMRQAPWRKEEVGVGVLWLAHHFEHLGPGRQNLHVLELEGDEPELVPARPTSGFARTSQLATSANAVAAVNGGFFGPRGEPIGLLQIDGRAIAPASAESAWTVGLPKSGALRFVYRESGEWPEVAHALAARPLLLRDGQIQPLDLGGPRHPRTAIGQRRNGVRVLLTCDGRTDQSLGLTMGELAHAMRGLDCIDALNLDGGGSTTLWVRDEPEGGVANCPCDNKRFDRSGERAVSNSLLVHTRDLFELDEDEAGLALEPAREWRRVENDARALHGDYAVASAGSGAAVRASYLPRRAGRVALELAFAPGAPSLVVKLPGSERRVDRRVGGERWLRVAEVEAIEGAPLAVQITALPKVELRFDALRWVELASPERASSSGHGENKAEAEHRRRPKASRAVPAATSPSNARPSRRRESATNLAADDPPQVLGIHDDAKANVRPSHFGQ